MAPCRSFRWAVLTLLGLGCGASMRPIPDDVEPAPRHLVAATVDAGVRVTTSASASSPDAPHDEPIACTDAQHRPLRIRRIAADRWVVPKEVVDRVLRNDGAHITPRPAGLMVEDAGTGCVAALGFETGDLVRSINGQDADVQALTAIYQSVIKDGSAVVRFERRGRAYTVVYEVSTE